MLTMTPATTEVAPISDADASPLSTTEANALLALSATAERKPTVKAGTRVERHWRQTGQVD
jgi:hypothetical protein